MQCYNVCQLKYGSEQFRARAAVVKESKTERHQAVPAAMCFVYARACLGVVLCYRLLQFISLWHSRLFNTGMVAASTNLGPCELDSLRVLEWSR